MYSFGKSGTIIIKFKNFKYLKCRVNNLKTINRSSAKYAVCGMSLQ